MIFIFIKPISQLQLGFNIFIGRESNELFIRCLENQHSIQPSASILEMDFCSSFWLDERKSIVWAYFRLLDGPSILVLGALLQNDLYRQTEGWVCPSGEERWVSVSSSCVFLAEHSGRPSLPTAFCPASPGPVIITRPLSGNISFHTPSPCSCTFYLCFTFVWPCYRFIEAIP